MKKLSEYKGEEAIILVSKLIDPIFELCSEKTIYNAFLGKGNKLKAIKIATQKHPGAVLKLLAILEGEEYETYKDKVTVFTLPNAFQEILEDEDLATLFFSQRKMNAETLSSSASRSAKE